MKRKILFPLSFLLLIIILFLVALYIPNSLPAHSDFSALYNADLALVHRVPIYELEQVEALAVQFADIPPEKFFLARFPYPPWYALSTFYLGLMPAKAAATLWFELNLLMLFLSVWLLTDGWPGRWRLVAFPLALFFYPVLGALSVGQYDFPVVLGTSFLVYSLHRKNIGLTVLGLVLLTFKPHVGALILLATLCWLFINKNNLGRQVARPLLGAALGLFLTGFIADPGWIVSYPKMLLGYQSEGNVSDCSECASLPVWLSRWLFDGSLAEAMWIAIVLLVILIGLFYFLRGFLKSHAFLLSAAVLATLLISPYLYNYDFLLLLVPFAVLVPQSNLLQRILLFLCYLIPTAALIVYGRAGNISLIPVTMVMLIVLYVRAKNPVIDFTGRAAYNNE
jgi:hypothetical protein